MKFHLILCATVATLIVPVTADSDTELGEKMDYFNDAYKSFRREKDPAKGAETAREAQLLIAKTLTLTPDLVSKMPDGPEKVKAAAAFRRMMGEVYVLVCKIEEAYLAGDMETVKELYGGLKDLKKVGHDQYMEE